MAFEYNHMQMMLFTIEPAQLTAIQKIKSQDRVRERGGGLGEKENLN